MIRISTLIGFLVFATWAFSCASQPDSVTNTSLLGKWEYKLVDSNRNVYDKGTIVFVGEKESGTWTQLNLYQVEYHGTWVLDGATIIVKGSETWKGAFSDAKHAKGNWTNDAGENGVFELVRFQD